MHHNTISSNTLKLKIFLLTTFCILFLAIFSGCSQERKEQHPYYIRVNSYNISEDELNKQLKFESEVDSNFHISDTSKSEFIERLIESQILLQEAKKLRLDEEEKFRQTIERYWQSTLIRDLLNKKGDELRKKALVSTEEIQDYFANNKEFLPDTPLEQQNNKIRKTIENEKVREEMQHWIESLRRAATIEIRDSVKDTNATVKQEK